MHEKEFDKKFTPPICLISGSYCDIFENMHEGVSIYKPIRKNGKLTDLEIMYFNSRSVLNNITTLKESVGKKLIELQRDNYITQFMKIANDILSKHKDKTLEVFFTEINKYYLITGFCTPDNFLIVLGMDITERKRSENSLKESENKYRAIFENTGIAFAVIEDDMTISLMNHESEKILGYSKEEVEGKRRWIEFIASKEDLERMKQLHIKRRLDPESTFSRYEFKAFNRKGEIMDILTNITLIRGTNKSIASFLDITRRKKNEIELRSREEEFRTLVEHSPDSITRFDKSLRHTFINRAGAAMTGLNPEEYIGKTHLELGMPSELAEEVDELLKRIFKTGKPEEFEFEIPSSSGLKHYYSYNSPEFDEYGNVKSVLAIAHDLTDRIKAENELRNSEKKFRATIEESYDGIMLIDEEKRIIEWNHAMEEITGLTKKDMVNTFLWDFMYQVLVEEKKTPKMYNRIKSMLIKNLSEENEFDPHHKIEREIQTPDYKRKFIESTIYPMKTDKGIMYGSITRDVTDKKILEEELKKSKDNLEKEVHRRTEELKEAYISLKESEEKYKQFFDTSPDATLHVDLTGIILNANKSALRSLGKSKNELVGMHFTEIGMLFPEDLAMHSKKFFHLIEKGYVKHYESRVIGKNGEILWGDTYPILLKKDGTPDSVLVISHNITPRKLAEEKLKETIEELEQSNYELQQFAYITSHDLQEPLRTIASYAGLIKRRYKGQLDQDADEFIDFMINGASRMKEMIQGLLDYSRVETLEEELKPVDSKEVVKDALKNLNVAIKESNARITCKNLPIINADKRQLIQVFQNLIGNAIKFKDPNKRLKIHISARKGENEYIFSVSDNGIGIEKQYTDKIFEVFKRLHTIDKYKGAGIGLAIVKRIIDRHEGSVWVDSTFGEGSTFYFTIPTS
ncbi:PAS domain S-box protein [Methanobacterium sp. ACI-7]|uniref:PAS domain S-box protein n=1 Tax=unclassified Methanobacterium TaxID=2627676 RepID=UPI0039C39771